MRNRKFWVCLIVASLLLVTLAACQNHATPDSGTSQSEQTTASTADTLETSNSTETSETLSNANWFAGSWTTVVRYDDRDHGEVVAFVSEITYGFGADGSGSIDDYGWMGHPGEQWKVGGMGFVETYFTYTLEGNTLTITHTGDEFEVYPEERRETDVYTVVRNDDGSVTWISAEDGESRVYRKLEMELSVEELLLLFGLDPNVPEN